jgi:hypothetical protein
VEVRFLPNPPTLCHHPLLGPTGQPGIHGGTICGRSSVVEHLLAKQKVAGPIPAVRSNGRGLPPLRCAGSICPGTSPQARRGHSRGITAPQSEHQIVPLTRASKCDSPVHYSGSSPSVASSITTFCWGQCEWDSSRREHTHRHRGKRLNGLLMTGCRSTCSATGPFESHIPFHDTR